MPDLELLVARTMTLCRNRHEHVRIFENAIIAGRSSAQSEGIQSIQADFHQLELFKPLQPLSPVEHTMMALDGDHGSFLAEC